MAGSIKLYGPSGYTEIAADVNADDNVLTLPSVAGSLLTAEGGKILQVVRATDTTERTTTSTSFVDVTGMSVTITPQKSDSEVLLLATALVRGDATSQPTAVIQITDNSNNGIAGAELGSFATANYTITGTATLQSPLILLGYATPATTSAVTYKLRFRVGGGSQTAVIRNNSQVGQMYAIEVSA
jgi:hypothetical protein